MERWFVGCFSAVEIGRYEYLWIIMVVSIVVFIFGDGLSLGGVGEDVGRSVGVK